MLDVVAIGGAATLSGCAVVIGLRKVTVKRIEVELTKLPQELAGFRIVQLTDVHIGPTLDGRWLREIVDRVNALAADAVVITFTGAFIRNKGINYFLEAMPMIAKEHERR